MITQLLIYSLKASLILALCYIPYLHILRHERFFRLNRKVLVAIMVFSLVLPAFNINWMSLDKLPVVQATYEQMVEAGLPVQRVDIESMQQVDVLKPAVHWFDVIAIVFFIGMIFSILFRFIQMGVLSYLLNRKNLWTRRMDDGIIICCRKGHFSPYSWINRIIISESDWDENSDIILLHEMGHIKAGHSYDILLLLLCQAMMWYNPFAWLLGNSLEDVHEYEADDYVLTQGVDAKSYMLLLVSKVAKWEGYSFVNSLNHSTLNKRIIMMKAGPALSSWRRSKVLYLLPVCALALSVFATPKVANPTQEALLKLEQEQAYFTFADVAPMYGKEQKDLYTYISRNIKYPSQAREDGIQGRVWVEFVVNTDGTLSDIRADKFETGSPLGMSNVINEVGVFGYSQHAADAPARDEGKVTEGNQALADEVVHLMEGTSGGWKPGYMQHEDGTQTPVAVKLTFPICFSIN